MKLVQSVLVVALIGQSALSAAYVAVAEPNRRLSDDEDSDEEQDDGGSGGVYLGSFTSYDHGLAGKVRLIDEQTIRISGLTYDGEGPASWFMLGNTEGSSIPEHIELDGIAIPDENDSCHTLSAYKGEDITLKVPADMKLSDYNYISMYCVRFTQNFGYVIIPDKVKLANGTSTITGCNQASVWGERLK